MFLKLKFKNWIPAFAGMTILLSSCSASYKRATIDQHIKEMAKKEYKLDVEVKDVGDTIGIQFEVKNFLGELVASDQKIWNDIENLMMVLGRVALSCDRPPKFLILDVVDADHYNAHLIFTRFVPDLQRIMIDAISRNDYLDRLLIEFELNGKRSVFDPQEMDIVKLMMMMTSEAIDPSEDESQKTKPSFVVEDVDFPTFLANVTANSLRRQLKDQEQDTNDFTLRQISGFYVPEGTNENNFRFQLDIVPKEKQSTSALISSKILPFVAEEAKRIFKSYKFDQFSLIKIVEKNSGQLLTVPKG